MRKLAVGVIGALAFALNPAFLGCGGTSYSFGAKEMSASITGTWKLTRGDTTLTFTMKQKKLDVEGRAHPGAFQEAAACGNRNLIATADACLDSTTMPLTLTFADGSKHDTKAELVVHGYDFRTGNLRLDIDDMHVNASIKPDGTVHFIQGDRFQLVHTP